MERKKEWQNVRLGDYISIKSGLAYKGCHIGKGESLLLGMGCVSFKEKFIESGARPYNDPSDDRFVVKPGDIVLATRQQSNNLPILAMPAIIPFKYKNKRVLFGTNLYKVENKSEIDNRFLFWLLKHQHYVNYIAGVKSGTAVQMVTKKNVEDYKFNCPPKSIRDKISNILWTYDTLIENNNRRIRLLEQMAENLYKEWFVRFRFPGHEKLENGLPKKWKIKRYEDELNIRYGKGLATEQLQEKGYPVFGSNGQIGFYKSYMYDKPQILISCRGASSGVVNISLPKSFITSNFLVCERNNSTESEFEYLKYYFLNTNLMQYQTGSAQPQITINNIKRLKLLIPEINVQRKFSKRVKAIDSEIFNLQHQNTLLTRQRDLLLPRLMSGKLEVKP